jgi:hypothetical protein
VQLVSCSHDATVKLWSLSSRQDTISLRLRFTEHTDEVYGLAYLDSMPITCIFLLYPLCHYGSKTSLCCEQMDCLQVQVAIKQLKYGHVMIQPVN